MSQVDAAILRVLRSAAGEAVRDRVLAREAAVELPVIAERIVVLREAGYEIKGARSIADGLVDYRLVSAPDRLIADDLRASLGACMIGNDIVVLAQTRSTNDVVLQMLNSEVREGFVVFAEQQTAGRGQRSNHWESAPNRGLWFSILLRPNIAVGDSLRLTRWAAEGIAAAIADELGVAPRIKLPNDLYIEDRKIAGILVEMRAEGPAHAAIVGVGINVNHTAEDFSEDLRERAGSLALATGKNVDRRSLAVALLRKLDATYREQFREKLLR
jgi:BirA family biotin operon repressor/biotin-[acetyl-CoA-carboxylase] ligase